MRRFEIISKEQFFKDMYIGTEVLYSEMADYKDIILPKRSTKKSAGYDFFSPIKITIPAKGMKKIPTCVKVAMEDDEILSIYPRSSIGFKTGIRLANTVGVIDSDYYNNINNEGHIFIKFYNPTDKDYEINIGDKIAQGIFTKYLIVDDEEEIENERSGGLGSTGK